MKIRTSFVSNSSSSSSITILSKKSYDEALKSLDLLQRDILEWIKKEAIIDDMTLVVIEEWSGEDGCSLDQYEPGDGKTGYEKGRDKHGEEYLDDSLEDAMTRIRTYNHFLSKQSY